MSFQSVCDAWAAELQTNVQGLTNAKLHLYAPWSVEYLYAERGERHLAIWPDPQPIVPQQFTTGPEDLDTVLYMIAVWEEALTDAARRSDDTAANLAWLQLGEAIQARLLVQANMSLGEPGSYTRRGRMSWDLVGPYRLLTVPFTVEVVRTFT